MSRGPVWSSWWPLTYLQYHIKVYFRILWSIAAMSLKWLERHEYIVLYSIALLIVFSPSYTIVIAPSRMLDFRLISSTMETTWKMPASSLLFAS